MKILKTIKIGQPRDIYELLSLMYINLKFEEYPFYGLCNYITMLNDRGLISLEEHSILLNYVTDNPPFRYKVTFFLDLNLVKLDDWFFCMNGGFYWRRDSKRPRLRWLKRHMKRNKNK